MSTPAEKNPPLDIDEDEEEILESPEETESLSPDIYPSSETENSHDEDLVSKKSYEDEEETSIHEKTNALEDNAPIEYVRGDIQNHLSFVSKIGDIFASSVLLRSDLFLSVVALTLLNALIFIHYANTRQTYFDLRSANGVIKEELGREFDFYLPLADFVNYHGVFHNQAEPQFSASLTRLRSKLNKLGLESDDSFLEDEFYQKNGGLYLSQRTNRALPTFP